MIYSGFTQTGYTHLKASEPCQDKFSCIVENGFSFFSVADGAGSAKFSHLGAENVIFNTFKIVKEHFDAYYDSNPYKVKRTIITYLLDELNIIARNKNTSLKDFSTTLLFVAIKNNKIMAGHVGDGLIAYRKLGKYKILSAPLNGEFINQTFFVTSKYFLQHFRIYRGVINGVDKLFLMTDGVTQGYYDRKNNSLSSNFESDISSLNYTSASELDKTLKDLMTKKIHKRTNDDSTLIVASI